MTHYYDNRDLHQFYNPIIKKGQDPWIVRYKGNYLLIQSENDSIVMYVSNFLSKLADEPKIVLWTSPRSGEASCNIWAPELIFVEGKWYIYFAADDGENAHHRMYVLESVTSNPMGTYREKGKIAALTDKWAIDGTILQYNSETYFIWSGWPDNDNVQQNLYIAPMIDPVTIRGERFLISEPTFTWEIPQTGGPAINEGPAVICNNDRLFLVYSGNGSWTDDYCLGMLTFKGGNILDRNCWIKSEQPVFAKSPITGAYGPGHNSFFRSPDNSEDWIIYHANSVSMTGWDGRSIRAQKFTWDNEGIPHFGIPVSCNTPLLLPSGE